jgi:hypothetical protein
VADGGAGGAGRSSGGASTGADGDAGGAIVVATVEDAMGDSSYSGGGPFGIGGVALQAVSRRRNEENASARRMATFIAFLR